MGLEQGGPQIGETSGSADGLGQVVGELRGPVGDDLVHQLAQPLLSDVGGERVDGDDAVGVQVLDFDGFPIGAIHDQPPEILLDFAGNRDGVADLETVGQPGLVEPTETQSGGAVVDDNLGDGHFAATQGTRIQHGDFADDGDLLTVENIPDRLELAVIFIAAREIVEHVAQGIEAQAGEHAGVARPDSGQDGQRGIESNGSLAGDSAGARVGAAGKGR